MLLSNLLQTIKHSKQAQNNELKNVATQVQPIDSTDMYSSISYEFRKVFEKRLDTKLDYILYEYSFANSKSVDKSLRGYVLTGIKENLNIYMDVFIDIAMENPLIEFVPNFNAKSQESKISTESLNPNNFRCEFKSTVERELREYKLSFTFIFADAFIKATAEEKKFYNVFIEILKEQVENNKTFIEKQLADDPLLENAESTELVTLYTFLPAIINSGFLKKSFLGKRAYLRVSKKQMSYLNPRKRHSRQLKEQTMRSVYKKFFLLTTGQMSGIKQKITSIYL